MSSEFALTLTLSVACWPDFNELQAERRRVTGIPDVDIVRAIMQVAHLLQLDSIAEGGEGSGGRLNCVSLPAL
jgi:hypothetical protein